jgi:hypothetical protein
VNKTNNEKKRKTRLLSNPIIHIEMQEDKDFMIGGDALDHLNGEESNNYDYFLPITSERID